MLCLTHKISDRLVKVVASTPGGLAIDVANEGAPIAPEEQQQLFQKYYRGRNAQNQPGAGLGLYLVRNIAARLGGSVELVETGGEAPVRFRLALPYRGGLGLPPPP